MIQLEGRNLYDIECAIDQKSEFLWIDTYFCDFIMS